MSVDENAAAVHILSDDLTADELIDKLGVEPDQKWNKNDPATASGKGRRRTSGLTYDSRLDPGRPIADHVQAVAERLKPATPGLLSLKSNFQLDGSKGSIRLALFSAGPAEKIEFTIGSEDLAFLSGVCTVVHVTVLGGPNLADT